MFSCSLKNKVKVTFTKRKEIAALYLWSSYHALPHSPCDTSRQRLSSFLLLLLILLLRYALSSTRISSTKLDVVLSSSSSSVSEELQTSITAKLSSNSPPSIRPAVLLILLCCVTPLVSVASFCWPVCVQDNSIHKPRQIGAYSCVYASRTKKPVGDHIIPQSIGHLSSCGPPFTWPRSTTICTVLSEMQAVTSDAHLFFDPYKKKSKQILPVTDKMFQEGDAWNMKECCN